jgi:hypothetical protein
MPTSTALNTPKDMVASSGELALARNASMVVSEVTSMDATDLRYVRSKRCARDGNSCKPAAFHASQNTNKSSAPIPATYHTDN